MIFANKIVSAFGDVLNWKRKRQHQTTHQNIYTTVDFISIRIVFLFNFIDNPKCTFSSLDFIRHQTKLTIISLLCFYVYLKPYHYWHINWNSKKTILMRRKTERCRMCSHFIGSVDYAVQHWKWNVRLLLFDCIAKSRIYNTFVIYNTAVQHSTRRNVLSSCLHLYCFFL